MLLFSAVFLVVAAEMHAASPNVVIILTDDQGYADVGVFGAKGFSTPHLDRMASRGMKFTNFHVAQPVCSASRTALLTGCYPNRIGIHGALGPGARHGLAASEVTIAELAKQKGYRTACFGKWHIGHRRPFLPTRHGFDEYYGIPYSNDMWPYHPQASGNYPPLPLIEGERVIEYNPDQRQLTTELTKRAVSFIERSKGQPFFLYVPHPQPHVPLFVSEKFDGKTKRGIYGDVIAEIDWSVGQILDALKRTGVEDNTLVFFLSDNGPWLSYGTHSGSALPLREGKGTAWEGGVRVPCIAQWPAKIKAGGVCKQPLMTIDILPTLAELWGAELPEHKIDGKSLTSVLASPDSPSPQESYAIYYHRNELQAVISRQWKLYFPHRYRTLDGREGGDDGIPVRYSHKRTETELYDLYSDVSEQNNLAKEKPEIVKKLLEHAESYRKDLGDALTKRAGTGHREPGRITD